MWDNVILRIPKHHPLPVRRLVTNLTEEEIFNAEYLSDQNLIYCYNEALNEILRGVPPQEVLNKRERRRLFLAGILEFKGRGEWSISSKYIAEIHSSEPTYR
jgi:hypothetical protein